MDREEINQISGQIVDAAIRVHSKLGPGLLESAYEATLQYELTKRGLRVLNQVPMPVVYDEVRLELGYRIDLLVEDVIVVEIKAVEAIHNVYKAQLLSYLKLSGLPVGLLLNFHSPKMKDGILRFAN